MAFIQHSKNNVKIFTSKKQCNAPCCNLNAEGNIIQWSKEAKYLGVYVLHGRNFSCSFRKLMLNFIEVQIEYLVDWEPPKYSCNTEIKSFHCTSHADFWLRINAIN